MLSFPVGRWDPIWNSSAVKFAHSRRAVADTKLQRFAPKGRDLRPLQPTWNDVHARWNHQAVSQEPCCHKAVCTQIFPGFV